LTCRVFTVIRILERITIMQHIIRSRGPSTVAGSLAPLIVLYEQGNIALSNSLAPSNGALIPQPWWTNFGQIIFIWILRLLPGRLSFLPMFPPWKFVVSMVIISEPESILLMVQPLVVATHVGLQIP